MSDLNFQNLSTVQSNQQPAPRTMASAVTMSPTTALTFVTGTEAMTTIVPPVTGYHELTFIFTDANPTALPTTGNVHAAYTPIQNQAFKLFYDPTTKKYWRGAVT